MCFQRTTVADAFNRAENPVYGWSRIDSLPNIGAYLRGQLAQHNIDTVNDFLAATRHHFSLARMEKFVASLVPNQNQHKCVTSDVGRYHVSDVNTCGYNTLIRTIQFAHTERKRYRAYQFNRPYRCNFAFNLALRHRGTQQGSRYCSCYNNLKTCKLHQACRWSKSEQVCIPNADPARIDDQAGFLGAANRRHQFRRNFRNRVYHTRLYKRNWQQLPVLQGGSANQHNQPHQPNRRNQPHQHNQHDQHDQHNQPHSSQPNQSLRQYVLQFEKQHNKKFGLLRRFYKFVT